MEDERFYVMHSGYLDEDYLFYTVYHEYGRYGYNYIGHVSSHWTLVGAEFKAWRLNRKIKAGR